jgi:NADPH2:quinone reductase
VIPSGVSFDVAAAALLKGITADMLLSRLQEIGSSSTVVVHAAAGGVGQFLTQMAKARGATVVGLVGTPEKAALARTLGCDGMTIYSANELPEVLADLSGGLGADMVFDGVGAATFETSLACLKPFGVVALFGQASGPVQAIDPARLAAKSLAVWRPIVFHHVNDPSRYKLSAAKLFTAIEEGKVKVGQPTRISLHEAAKAHELLAASATTGSTVLIP